MNDEERNKEDRPIQFTTVMMLTILLGIIMALTNHLFVLSSVNYNIFG